MLCGHVGGKGVEDALDKMKQSCCKDTTLQLELRALKGCTVDGDLVQTVEGYLAFLCGWHSFESPVQNLSV